MPTVKDLANTLEEVKQFSKVDADYLVKIAREEGSKLRDQDLKNHQIRRFFEAMKGIERTAKSQLSGEALTDDIVAELVFLKPHLINAAVKQKGFRKFAETLEQCINPEYFKNQKDLNRFIRFFEAVVAYHS